MSGPHGGPGQPPGSTGQPPGAVPFDAGRHVGDVRAALGAELSGLEREMAEIGLLIEQVTLEAERHEARRARAEERAAALERDPRTPPADANEAHGTLLALTKRSLLFESQREVLEGKLKTLTRYRDGQARTWEALGPIAGLTLASAPGPAGQPGSGGAAPGPGAGAGAPRPAGGRATDAMALLRSQEELRRELVRQLHDGPAQSLANIALQAEIVQRLVARNDVRAQAELVSMRRMVQHALDTTKEFIFDVRPMVLDDLGLAPTLRRAAADRGRRSGLPIEFESRGSERRLAPDLESGLFRCVDEAMSGYVAARPGRVAVRLDWTDTELRCTIGATWPEPAVGATPEPPTPAPAPGSLPPALAAMIEEERSQGPQAGGPAHAMAGERLSEIAERARVLGVRLTLRDDGRSLELATDLEI